MRTRAVALAASLAAACASTPEPPEWHSNAHLALKNFEAAYLKGDTRIAESEFARARYELASTGRADIVARAELARCAVQAASLAFDDCPGFAALAAQASGPDKAYAEYIAGRWQGLQAGLLPAQHRPVLSGGALPEDPLARLVAASAQVRAGRIAPEGIAAAIDAASARGWRRPLLAWLGLQEKRAVAAGDVGAATQIRQRIELTTQGGRL